MYLFGTADAIGFDGNVRIIADVKLRYIQTAVSTAAKSAEIIVSYVTTKISYIFSCQWIRFSDRVVILILTLDVPIYG